MKIINFDIELLSTSTQRQFARERVYTNDFNSVQIDFNIVDMSEADLTGATAQVLLFMMDGSFFQNGSADVTLTGTTFSYLLKENEGNHAGIARVQLVVTTADSKEYASQKLEFEIITGLETAVATEVMIQDWTTLTREARDYIDVFTAAEVERQAMFEENEMNRKDIADEDHEVYINDHNTAVSDHNKAVSDHQQASSNHTQAISDHEQATADTQRFQGYENRIVSLEVSKIKRYGVKFTGSNPVGERLYDAVGMVANVAVDDEIVQNDFDKVSFYNRPMCNVYFDATGKPQVMAYRGEPGFDFDGAIFPPRVDKADVYYECAPCAWNGSFDESVVTGTPTEGFELFPCFPDWNTKIYLPTFWMSVVDNKPTSRSGTLPGYFSINTAFSTAQAWNTNAHGETILAHMYEYILQVIEFATRDVQTVMTGAMSLRYNSAADIAVIAELGTNRIVLENASADQYVVGQTIVIGMTSNATNVATERSITTIETYDANSKAIIFDGDPVNIEIGNFISSRVWKNGATNIVVASSGSPISNTSGKYPCIWRGKADPWANGYSGIGDLLAKRNGLGTPEDPYTYKPYYLPDPRLYSNGAITDDYVELNYNMSQVDGYALTLGQDARYKSIGLTTAIGAGSTTYFSDYYHYPRYDVSAVFVGGNFGTGRYCGPLSFNCFHSPSLVLIYRLARLFVSRA